MKTQNETRIQEIGLEIFDRADRYRAKLDMSYFSSRMMAWSMDHPDLKVNLFRFVDVLPTLSSSKEVVKHLREYLLESDGEVPFLMESGLRFALSNKVTDKIAATVVRKNVSMMAKTFITGESSKKAERKLKQRWDEGTCFTVDILGEAVVSHKEAESYTLRYLELVEGLAKLVPSWDSKRVLEANSLGALPRANVSVKCSSLYPHMSELAFRESVEGIKFQLRRILKAAVDNDVFVYLDMEQHDYKDIIITVAEEVFLEDEFKDYPHFGIVIQAYLVNALDDLRRILSLSIRRSHPLTVRLVKGAYWDFENILASQRGWKSPVFQTKPETDAHYEVCGQFLLDSYPKILPAFASHNVRSLASVMTYAEDLGVPREDVEIQMLFGMADNFRYALKDMGYRVRDYAPVGEILPGMAYLVRRLLENTSNEGFLKQSEVDHADRSILLANPNTKIKDLSHLKKVKDKKVKKDVSMTFENHPPLDFGDQSNRKAIGIAIESCQKKFPIQTPIFINGKKLSGKSVFKRVSPNRVQTLVNESQMASKEQAIEAIEIGRNAFKEWSQKPVEERSKILNKAADLMNKHRNELISLIVWEVGKGIESADADVCEAIDFCRYYADLASDMFDGREIGQALGEQNRYIYSGKGVVVAIAPWNFPFAILCGMTAGPLVCGNPVVMKPAEQSAAVGYKLYEIFREAGVPGDVLQFLPGQGEEIGPELVNHKDVHVINFTGSRQVGLQIYEAAAKVQKGQRHIKKVIAEMGGKNAVIVDSDADLDEAVMGCMESVFGFAGQKCSALSRIIVLDSIYDSFKERFAEALQSLRVAPSNDFQSQMGPVVDQESYDRLVAVRKKFKTKIVAQLDLNDDLVKSGYFVPPTIFETDDTNSELAQNEFFGPLVTLIRVKDLDQALKVMNDTDYALTGGVFSRSPKSIERVRNEAEVGNLYINRSITGALVCRQPFGGYKLSGVGGKAGGPDYLLHFVEPRTITENTMRRGFSPDVVS